MYVTVCWTAMVLLQRETIFPLQWFPRNGKSWCLFLCETHLLRVKIDFNSWERSLLLWKLFLLTFSCATYQQIYSNKGKVNKFRIQRSSQFMWIHLSQGQNKYLLHTRVVQEGEEGLAESRGGGLIVHYSNLDAFWISSDTQTDEGDLDDGQQELETQRAANTE